MRKHKVSLFALSLALCACAAGQGPSPEDSASSKDPSAILSPEASSSESVSSSEEFTIDKSIFKTPFDDEDVVYQRILKSILEERKQRDYNGKEETSGEIVIYCRESENGKGYEAKDFPEVDAESFECYDNGAFCNVFVTLGRKTRNHVLSAVFALKENPRVIYSYYDGFKGFLFPWTKCRAWDPPQLKASSEKEDGNGFDAEGITLDYYLQLDEVRFNGNRHLPGYVLVSLKLSENGNGRVFAPEDFPGIGCSIVVENPVWNDRRRLVVGIEEQTIEATTEALYALVEDPLVWWVDYYAMGGSYYA